MTTTTTIKPPRLEDVRILQKADTVPPGWFTSKALQAEWNLCESQTRRLIMNAVAAGKASSKKFKIDTGGYTPRATAHYQFKS
jgi:hypothetical protein